MGRPLKIQKGNIQDNGGSSNGHTTGGKGGSGSGLIEVSGTAVDGSTTSTEALTLTAKAPGSLVAGEFCVQAIGDDSTVYYVHKFHNRGCSVSSDAGSSFKFFGMNVLAEGTDEGTSSGFVSVDSQ
jgi:hypothetical protein